MNSDVEFPTLPMAPIDTPIIQPRPNIAADCLKILRALDARDEMLDGPTSADLAKWLETKTGRANYYLDTLEDLGFVGCIVDRDFGSQYHITKKGRKYLYENADIE